MNMVKIKIGQKRLTKVNEALGIQVVSQLLIESKIEKQIESQPGQKR